ncbi:MULTISPECIES: hypothetical protein [Pseudomonas syringae group]|uniref:Conjugal transfer protein n=1 Tax=Pseudomonas syringae pv. helianthi TaxID=251654 RepID=A0A0P9TYT1_9PSED|nr:MULTISPECIES: hypothetical protein [Pseudomonas syringae group]KPX46812.1 hypothetical protein ALO68_200085 [Pseudomonas syringae pv. helianthi]MCK0551446.1 hypothetical protein [Pseudomonas syringae pv. aptata]UNB65999.1 hypothetical protein MME54_27755 [Pseudomonas syringae pv. helianthi]SFP08881.1 hypothetical protein SAMN05444063_1602 [Pseudomonas syringae]
MIDVTIESSASGNAKKIEMRSASPTRSQHFGTMSVAPQLNSLRLLSIENHKKTAVRQVGSRFLEIAGRMRSDLALSSVSLMCQDEGAAKFFYKNGFRFVGSGADAKNSALKHHIDHPEDALPDEIVFLGDMERK